MLWSRLAVPFVRPFILLWVKPMGLELLFCLRNWACSGDSDFYKLHPAIWCNTSWKALVFFMQFCEAVGLSDNYLHSISIKSWLKLWLSKTENVQQQRLSSQSQQCRPDVWWQGHLSLQMPLCCWKMCFISIVYKCTPGMAYRTRSAVCIWENRDTWTCYQVWMLLVEPADAA